MDQIRITGGKSNYFRSVKLIFFKGDKHGPETLSGLPRPLDPRNNMSWLFTIKSVSSEPSHEELGLGL